MDAHDQTLIREALRFFVWAAGEGISPQADEPASEPEGTLFEYACATGDEDYDGIPDRIMARLEAAQTETETVRLRKALTWVVAWAGDEHLREVARDALFPALVKNTVTKRRAFDGMARNIRRRMPTP